MLRRPRRLGGRVSDESGAIVQGATVTLSDAKGAQAAISGADGTYNFPRLNPGRLHDFRVSPATGDTQTVPGIVACGRANTF